MFGLTQAARRCGLSGARQLSAEHITKIGVVGSGQMGSGIAFVAAVNAKRDVLLNDVSPQQLEKGLEQIDKWLASGVSKGRMTEDDSKAARARIRTSSALEDLRAAGVGLVVEAATENVDLKRKIFSQLSSLTAPDVILATNTSSISITKIAAATDRPEKVIGMHFFSPVPVMKITEIILGLRTSSATHETTLALAHAMGKTTSSSQDRPGFIANRLLMPYINEAVLALQEGVGSKHDIDTTMRLGTNVPMGPLRLADFIGLDTCLSIMRVLHDGFGDSKYRPAPLLQQYVDAGLLGQKAGRGFYDYSDPKNPQ